MACPAANGVRRSCSLAPQLHPREPGALVPAGALARRRKNLTICPQLLLRVAIDRPFVKECMSSAVGK